MHWTWSAWPWLWYVFKWLTVWHSTTWSIGLSRRVPLQCRFQCWMTVSHIHQALACSDRSLVNSIGINGRTFTNICWEVKTLLHCQKLLPWTQAYPFNFNPTTLPLPYSPPPLSINCFRSSPQATPCPLCPPISLLGGLSPLYPSPSSPCSATLDIWPLITTPSTLLSPPLPASHLFLLVPSFIPFLSNLAWFQIHSSLIPLSTCTHLVAIQLLQDKFSILLPKELVTQFLGIQ